MKEGVKWEGQAFFKQCFFIVIKFCYKLSTILPLVPLNFPCFSSAFCTKCP